MLLIILMFSLFSTLFNTDKDLGQLTSKDTLLIIGQIEMIKFYIHILLVHRLCKLHAETD